jgi:hypothetical protein
MAARKRPENSSMAVSTILYKSTLIKIKFLHMYKPAYEKVPFYKITTFTSYIIGLAATKTYYVLKL